MNSWYKTESAIAAAGFKSHEMTALREFSLGLSSERIHYPWHGAECLAADGKLWLVAYGSLINRALVPTTSQGDDPVLAMGAKRLFNYVIPHSALSRYGSPCVTGAGLNVRMEDSEHSLVNGRLVRLGLQEFLALREQEIGYDLCATACVPWHGELRSPFRAYILSCERDYFNGTRLLDEAAPPLAPYYALCRKGAELIGPEFLDVFLKTTFLADGRTSMHEWEEIRQTSPPERHPDKSSATAEGGPADGFSGSNVQHHALQSAMLPRLPGVDGHGKIADTE